MFHFNTTSGSTFKRVFETSNHKLGNRKKHLIWGV